MVDLLCGYTDLHLEQRFFKLPLLLRTSFLKKVEGGRHVLTAFVFAWLEFPNSLFLLFMLWWQARSRFAVD